MLVHEFFDVAFIQDASGWNFVLAWPLQVFAWLLTFSKERVILLTLSVLLTLLLVENLAPRWRVIPAVRRRSYRMNSETFVINDVVLSLMTLPSLQYFAERFSHYGLLHNMQEGWLKWLLCFVLLDLVFYLWHRANHCHDWLWTFHRIHHSDKDLNVTTALRFHFGELVLTTLLKAVFIVTLGVSAQAVLVAETVIRLFVLLHHANIAIPGERKLSLLIVGPALHRLHHSTVRTEHDQNYGLVFSLWDRLFGTRADRIPDAIGLPGSNPSHSLELLTLGLPWLQRAGALKRTLAVWLGSLSKRDVAYRWNKMDALPPNAAHATRALTLAKKSSSAVLEPVRTAAEETVLRPPFTLWVESATYTFVFCSVCNKRYIELLAKQQQHWYEFMRQAQSHDSSAVPSAEG